MKITNYDKTYSQGVITGGILLGSTTGSNSGYSPDVVGTPGDLSVVALRQRVSLASNMGDNAVGTVLTTISSSPWIAQFAMPSNTAIASNAMTRTGGGDSANTTIAASGTAKTLMVGGANDFAITLTANCTIGFTGWPASGHYSEISVVVTEDGTGGWTPTFSGVTWIGGTTPTHTTTAGSSTEYAFWTRDGGTTIVGGQVGSGGSSFATPSIVLGTAAAAGAASTTIRSDATIVAFDSTAPTTAAAGDAAATGSAAVAARRDHRHGMPASFGVGEILISDTPAGSPLVFADLIQNEAQDDLVYADP